MLLGPKSIDVDVTKTLLKKKKKREKITFDNKNIIGGQVNINMNKQKPQSVTTVSIE